MAIGGPAHEKPRKLVRIQTRNKFQGRFDNACAANTQHTVAFTGAEKSGKLLQDAKIILA